MKRKIEKQLEKTEAALKNIVGALLQHPSRKTTQRFLNVALGKMTGVAAVGGISGLIAAFGSASTGTAIASLSGAAANTAALYWLGSFVGGGVLAGSIALTGVGLVAGVVAALASRHYVFGRQRDVSNLPDEERLIVDACGAILKAFDTQRELDVGLSPLEIIDLRDALLKPLLADMGGRSGDLHKDIESSACIDGSLAMLPRRRFRDAREKLRRSIAALERVEAPEPEGGSVFSLSLFSGKRRSAQTFHLKPKEKREEGISKGIPKTASVIVAVTVQKLLTGAREFDAVEEQLVIEAIRRSSKELSNASLDEIADHVGQMSPAQATGFLNNVKGIYHELIFANAENTDGDEVMARLHPDTNHAGSDVEFVSNGTVISSVQLKATDSVWNVREHMERYPDIDVLVTEETARRMDDVDSSGFANADLKDNVSTTIEKMGEDTLISVVGDAAATSMVVSGVLRSRSIIKNRGLSRDEAKGTLRDISVGGGTAAILELLVG